MTVSSGASGPEDAGTPPRKESRGPATRRPLFNGPAFTIRGAAVAGAAVDLGYLFFDWNHLSWPVRSVLLLTGFLLAWFGGSTLFL